MSSQSYRILAIHNGTGSRLWRINPYLEYLESQGHKTILHLHGEDINPIEYEWADIMIAQIVAEKKVIEKFKEYGATVIYEIDDLIKSVSWNHPHAKMLNSFKNRYRIFNCMRKSDAVFVSTQALYDRYKKSNSNIYHFPNLLHLPYWEKDYKPNTSDEIRIGWCGSHAHHEDLRFLSPILAKVLDKYDNVKFIYVGMGGVHEDANKVSKFIYGKDLFQEILPEKKEYHEGTKPEPWADKLASLRLDIGLAPVMDSKFSRAKSNIKWQEYSINRIPGIYSDVLYSDTVKHMEDGILVKNTEEEWTAALDTLIKNEMLRRQISKRAYKRAREEFNIIKQFEPWTKAMFQIHQKVQKNTNRGSLKELRQKQKQLQ